MVLKVRREIKIWKSIAYRCYLKPWEWMRWSHLIVYNVRRERVKDGTTQTPILRDGKIRKLKWKQKEWPELGRKQESTLPLKLNSKSNHSFSKVIFS